VRLEGGRSIALGDAEFVFLFRARQAALFASTHAFVSQAGFVKEGDLWTELESGATFDPERGDFRGARVRSLKGLDTFWYNWSLSNPNSRVLE
jgi:hypothetical protein